MNNIIGALEQEYSDQSQAERDALIAELTQLEADGRGQVDVVASALLISVLTTLFGAAMLYAGVAKSSGGEALWFSLGGAALLLFGLYILLLRSKKPTFSLTQDGVQVGEVLLPWHSIEDFTVMDNTQYGVTVQTNVSFDHVPGYVAPKLPLPRYSGGSAKQRKTDAYISSFNLFVKARGMSAEQLAAHIQRFYAGALARARLQELQADSPA